MPKWFICIDDGQNSGKKDWKIIPERDLTIALLALDWFWPWGPAFEAANIQVAVLHGFILMDKWEKAPYDEDGETKIYVA